MARLRAIAPLCKVDIWGYYRYAFGSYGGRYIGTRCATMDSDWADYDSTIRIYEVDDDHQFGEYAGKSSREVKYF